MPDTTPIREHNFGEGPNRAKHSGYAQGGRKTRTYHRESSIHRRKGPAPTPDYDDIDSPEAYIGYKRFIDPEGSGPIHDVSHDYNPPREDLPYNSWGFPGTWTVCVPRQGFRRARLSRPRTRPTPPARPKR